MQKNIYLVVLISHLLHQIPCYAMDCKQITTTHNTNSFEWINKITTTTHNTNSFEWINNDTLAIANDQGCYFVGAQNNQTIATLHIGSSRIYKVFQNNKSILLSKNNTRFMVYDVETKNEILPSLSKKCATPFLLDNKLFFLSYYNGQPHIIDNNNQKYDLPVPHNAKFSAYNPVKNELLFTPIDRPYISQKWTLINLDSIAHPKITEITSTIISDLQYILHAIFSSNGKYIACQGQKEINPYISLHPWLIYNLAADKIHKRFNCYELTFSPNNSVAAYVSQDQRITYTDLTSDNIIASHQLPVQPSPIYASLAFSPDGEKIAALVNNRFLVFNVPFEALYLPNTKNEISLRSFFLKSFKYNQINSLPNELLSLIIKNLILLFRR